MVKEVAKRIVGMLERDEMVWLIERGKFKWVRIKNDKPRKCGACSGTINEGEFADLLCVDYAFRKMCIGVFCEFCSRQLKRRNALVNAIHEIRLNGRETM